MNLIFYGFLVMLLGIEVNGLSLAPLFQIGGYALVMQGIQTVDKNNPYFKRAVPLIIALFALSGLAFVMSVSNIFVLAMPVGLATTVVSLIVVYNVIKGIQVYKDELQTPDLTTKLFKRWRLSVILFISTFVVVIVGVILLMSTLPLAALAELIAQVQANPTSELAIAQLVEPLLPFAGIVFGLSIMMIVLVVTGIVFYIMFLVSLYNVQKEFALRTPSNYTPTDFPNPQ
jgi:hypothetical protein